MRRLTKGRMPTVLAVKGAEWHSRYINAINVGSKPPSVWRHRDIRDSLMVETGKRCAYCDGNMMAVTLGHIEHKLPRVARPDLVIDWFNLTLACPRCNLAKSDYYSPGLPLLDPYIDDPDDHLIHVGNLVFPLPGSDRGKITVLRLALSRSDLVEARGRRLDAVAQLVDSWARSEGSLREAIAQVIVDDFREGEFRASVRSFLNIVGFPVGAASDEALVGGSG